MPHIILKLWRVLSLGNTRCKNKTMSSPDLESTYTNRASFEALAVCYRSVGNSSFLPTFSYTAVVLPIVL